MRRPEDKKGRRQHQVAELLRAELSQILWRQVKDPRLGHLTITEVDLKPDLRSAKVFVSKLPEGENPRELTDSEVKELEHGLKSVNHFIYEALKKRLMMKVIPAVHFEYDFRWKNLSKVFELTQAEGASSL